MAVGRDNATNNDEDDNSGSLAHGDIVDAHDLQDGSEEDPDEQNVD